MVESVRIGTVIASDKKALNHWRNRRYRSAQRSRALSGEALEAAVMNLATMFPGNVSRGIMEAA
jgi:hypothetical protein